MPWISCLSVFFSGFWLTGMLCKLAWHFGFVDKPDARRAHMDITPRGGGLALTLSFLAWLLYAIFCNHLDKSIFLPLLPAFLIAMTGLWDDISPLSAKFRLCMQFLCAFLSLELMHGIRIPFAIFNFEIPYMIMYFIALIFLVWCVNLYNFMDGVNGIAGFEALCVSIFMAVLTYIDGEYQWSWIWAILSSAVASFLCWNFPRAKIFLGDVGSYFLGFMFGLLLIQSAHIKPRWFWCGLILLGYFVIDATVTLLVRIWYRQPIFQAHTTHAFQILYRNFQGSHAKVTGTVLAINLLWLMPWAFLVSKGYIYGFYALLISYLPLGIIVWFVKAGRPQSV